MALKCPHCENTDVHLYGADSGAGIHPGNTWRCYRCEPYGRTFRDDSPEALARIAFFDAKSKAWAAKLGRKET